MTSILSQVSLLCEHNKLSKDKKEELQKPLQVPRKIKLWIESGLYEYMKKENN